MEAFSVIAAVSVIICLILVIYLLSVVKKQAKELGEQTGRLNDKTERTIRDSVESLQRSQNESLFYTREELNKSITSFGTGVQSQIMGISQLQQSHLEEFGKKISQLSDKNEARLEQMRETVERRIKELQYDNNNRLEQMRAMVDEQLTTKLQKRLDDSFTIVSERLEQVYKGLGEMQTLASGVGDLKKVLTNVKTRGIWGEYQLGQLLEQMLAQGQYAQNVPIPQNGKERVEFAIKMPGKDDDCVWIPKDSKFPQEDYMRLVEASESGTPEKVRTSIKQLEVSIKNEAKRIRDKYIKPPYTTDFAIMYLPVEGLYAEVLRIPGMAEMLQREYRVVPSGPTTLTALLNSLQMGFRTLAIEKRSNEVWDLLGAFKTEFNTFADTLQKTKKKLQEASNTMETMETRTRVINRKLKGVQELDIHTANNLIELEQEEELKEGIG